MMMIWADNIVFMQQISGFKEAYLSFIAFRGLFIYLPYNPKP
jgi:hypothetical protein